MGPPSRAPKAVVANRRLKLASPVIVPAVGIQRGVLQVFVQRPPKTVAAVSSHERNLAARSAHQSRTGGGNRHAELLHAIGRRRYGRVPGDHLLGNIQTVQSYRVLIVNGAADPHVEIGSSGP